MAERFARLALSLVFALSFLLSTGCAGPKTKALPSTSNSSRYQRDPVEDDPRFKAVFETIDQEVNEFLKDHPDQGRMGFVHIFWETKKKILKDKYGIDWRSPGELNPHIMFD